MPIVRHPTFISQQALPESEDVPSSLTWGQMQNAHALTERVTQSQATFLLKAGLQFFTDPHSSVTSVFTKEKNDGLALVELGLLVQGGQGFRLTPLGCQFVAYMALDNAHYLATHTQGVK